MKTNLTLFPLPYMLDGQRFDGSIAPWPSVCDKCKTKSCETASIGSLHLCSYGFNYQRIDKDMVIAGFVLMNWAQLTPARKKRFREFPDHLVSLTQLHQAIESLSRDSESVQRSIEQEKENIIEQYVKNEGFKPEFLEPLKIEIMKGLAFVHDYKQINAQIAQNINVIIETKYHGNTIDQKLESATAQERAIYKASKILEEKLNVARFLTNPSLMNKEIEFKKFRLHGLIVKYTSIYSTHIHQKSIDLSITGTSFKEIIAHPEAIAVIPHTFIDNAIKYSPKNGKIEIYVQDNPDSIDFSVLSHGPRILPGEEDKIFLAFYRGIAAKKQEEEGAGYGLYVSQLIALNHLGTKINVSQDSRQKPHYGHLTTFSITFPLTTKIGSQFKLLEHP